MRKSCRGTVAAPHRKLTAFHFLATFAGLGISAAFGLFSKVRLSVIRVLPISLAFCGFVVFNNLSLQYNNVGVYQLLKVLTTPMIVFLDAVLNRRWLPFDQL